MAEPAVEGRGLPEQTGGVAVRARFRALPVLGRLPPFPYVPLSLDTRSNTQMLTNTLRHTVQILTLLSVTEKQG